MYPKKEKSFSVFAKVFATKKRKYPNQNISINEQARQQIPIRGIKSQTIVAQPTATNINIFKFVNNQRQIIKNILNLFFPFIS